MIAGTASAAVAGYSWLELSTTILGFIGVLFGTLTSIVWFCLAMHTAYRRWQGSKKNEYLGRPSRESLDPGNYDSTLANGKGLDPGPKK